ncbi:MAG: phosphate ABC transporter permease subunit PstC [Rhodobacteraceae bacterium]|nr:phosphate ABC transporter permease subunit PstC [Paracoccaceae bacterium]
MSAFWLLVILLVLSALGFVLGRRHALAQVAGNQRLLHSQPLFYGWHVALLALVPSVLLLGFWLVAQPLLVNRAVQPMMTSMAEIGSGAMGLAMSDVHRVATGLDLAIGGGALSGDAALQLNTQDTDIRALLAEHGTAVGTDVSPETLAAAQRYRALNARGAALMTLLCLGLALAGGALALARTKPEFRARNLVEQGVKMLLIAAAMVAILTTLGIILSLIFNTLKFFGLYAASDFFLGTVWSPSFGGGSQLGIMPLIWGTLYISTIALAVAVPIGLFAAIYLSEYAGPKMRAFAKPMLEVLAGIPTIVYGLFALLTVGPMLVSFFGDGGTLGVEWMRGGTAVMTAGLVMGIMLIPFVSSLSDDIINAVPQSLRDGSYALGSTKSETIKQVVLPAALPGIVGAILLAASRAIGETMIVVMGAGAAARLSMNPFDAMTTVTAKIVSQLTGDADFSSPEALVAFSLALTLFALTLVLNIFALWIVRKYREQYE